MARFKKIFDIKAIFALLFILTASMGIAREYVIYSIMQDIPMGEPREVVKKNFYMNIGKRQGVKEGTELDVFRNISILDPYNNKQRYNYKVRIGLLEVIHSEDEASIGMLKELYKDTKTPFFELEGIMIGDKVDVSVRRD
ncbi:MAG: hypothetical protein A2504_06785 [Bdellovibrionales bacterium RIFOXYD12_FULL_39_22]|nr:MAG: hypothetical protein A2385_09105 [Bdellovibrionales bacterium RIFOXYB1_FULL_39_21]OFZ45145.1 MAG: hypothetical protein A2485_05435 [Bdellovibrionales bacterium RIFOXYC12_FULL_39_17]OFZ45663.1 MAG: hypothetical protein A2404_03685 [Bdellovibrionales bacterium RIFOXYC1_FULL_39_130]OFZ71775.1 MAG: hypothetical protein A2451_07000 [Bdellovibrionales bacterium RIFOXYC2_FULL_39_8]OFZ77525.1 MAG: hypothetical protein A2560_09270 [Bdellovibrionales bacterium RIFOXYD1_FULL_39_84]OFZ91654.1 MAG: